MGLKKIAQNRIGGLLLVILSLGVIGWAAVNVWGFFSGTAQPGVWYIDTETGTAFKHVPTENDGWAVESPATGKKTGVPAELCWWKSDGSIRDEPFPQVVDDKPGAKPTFCPDCGRLVVPHNPGPRGDMKPPPTKAEYDKLPHR